MRDRFQSSMPRQGSNGDRSIGKHAPYFISLNGGSRVELVEHARASGRENLPSPNATEPNELEAAVQLEHERQHLDLAEAALREVRALLEAARSVVVRLPEVAEISVTTEKANAEIERQIRLDRELAALLAERELRRRDRRKFMRDEGISREARYPSSRILHVGIVCLLLVVESWANAAYFAGGNAFGVVGGALQALALSAVNVGSGFCSGFFAIRHFQHRAVGMRFTAALSLIVTGAFALLFNLAAAHYRDLTCAGVLNPRIAVSSVLRDPLDLTLSSMALFATGLLAFGLAAWKGFRLDDPHPGFGEMDRRYRQACDAYGHARIEFIATALSRIERIPEDCAPILDRCDQVVHELQERTIKAHAAKERYETEREHLEDRCELPLRRYRDENRMVRTAPEPPYFATYPRFTSCIPESTMQELDHLLETARIRQAELGVAVRAIANSTVERLRTAADRIELHLARLEAEA